MRSIAAAFAGLILLAFAPLSPAEDTPPSQKVSQEPYTAEEIAKAANSFFGETTEGLAKVIERVFKQQGQPNAYIVGEEAGGAFAVGLRYGKGTLKFKGGAEVPVFWQGPSIGWDFGGNAARVLTLVYNLQTTDQLFQRYPGVDGSVYLVGGVGVNYQRAGDVTLAPIRTGLGWRAGASVGYLHYTRESSWIPF